MLLCECEKANFKFIRGCSFITCDSPHLYAVFYDWILGSEAKGGE